MGKYESDRSAASRADADVDKAFRQMTKAPAAPKKKPGAKSAQSRNQAAKRRKIIVISSCSAVLLLLIGLIVTLIIVSAPPEDDGRILPNVYAGGVNLGGMTQDEAGNALHLATDSTLSQKDMVITLADTSIILPPSQTNAKLNVDAVVEAAYQYGRGGSAEDLAQAKKDAAATTHTIALLPYMNLDLDFVRTTIEDFCNSYSSVMTQPTATITGDRPAYDPEYPDLVVEHQVLTIVMGTPDYILNANDIYNRALDAYSLNQMEVAYQPPTQTEPDVPNAEALFKEFCVAPVDAFMDPTTLEVTPEIYGYGFDIPAVQKLIDNAAYGETLTIPMGFLLPQVTAEDLTEGILMETLATITVSNIGGNTAARDNNLLLSCQAINNFVLKSGEEFSFNDVVGRLTALKGYQKASPYNNGAEPNYLGGGVSQTASALYYCALMADLEIVERHDHNFAVSFIELGYDANVIWGSKDLVFKNNTNNPIHILATADGGNVTIQFLGINEKDYTVDLSSNTLETYNPLIIKQTMAADNVFGYTDGHVLEAGITGYKVETYIQRYDAVSGELIGSVLVDTSEYSKRDETVVSIGSDTPGPVTPPVIPEDPGTPGDPVIPGDPLVLVA